MLLIRCVVFFVAVAIDTVVTFTSTLVVVQVVVAGALIIETTGAVVVVVASCAGTDAFAGFVVAIGAILTANTIAAVVIVADVRSPIIGSEVVINVVTVNGSVGGFVSHAVVLHK